jgi:hypothetical protein
MLVTKQKLGCIPIVLESTFFIHPNGYRESCLDQKPPDSADTPDENMSREEPYDGTEAQFAEDEEDDTSQNRGEGKGDKRGSNDRLGVVFSNNFDDIVREDVEERNNFYHHPADSTCETATTGCEHELRDNCRNEEEGYTHGTKTIENGHGGKQDHAIRDAIQNVEK